MIAIIIVVSWLIVILAKALIDNYQLNQHKHIYHGRELVAVIFVAIIHGILSGVRKPDWYALDMLIFQAFSFWFFFDGTLSTLRRKPWLYIGKMAVTDKFFRRIGMSFYPWSKVIAGIFVVYSCIQLYKYWE